MSKIFTEPHSTKPIEDAVGWALETHGETLVATQDGRGLTPEEARALAAPCSLPGARDPRRAATRSPP